MVAFQLAAGRLPFDMSSVDVLQAQVTSASYSWPTDRDFDSKLKRFVSACLRINPKCRRSFEEGNILIPERSIVKYRVQTFLHRSRQKFRHSNFRGTIFPTPRDFFSGSCEK